MFLVLCSGLIEGANLPGTLSLHISPSFSDDILTKWKLLNKDTVVK